MFLLVSYDIPSDKRRLKVMNALKDHGKRVQYSVFECKLTALQVRALQERLRKVIEPEEDDVRFYFLCETCVEKMRRLGRPREKAHWEEMILV